MEHIASQPASNLIAEARGVLERNRGRWPEADWRTLDQFVRLASDEPDSRIIETVEQLDALPDGSIIFDGDKDVMTKWDTRWHFWGSDEDDTDAEVHLPAQLWHHPEYDQ